MHEASILLECGHPFVMELCATYQTRDELFLLTEIIQGGELWSYIYDKKHLLPRTKAGGFTAPHAKFFAGCVILALGYIHSLKVVYRDLKPENLLMDAKGVFDRTPTDIEENGADR